MKKMAIILAIGFIFMVVTVTAAGRAFDSFTDSVDTSKGFAGSSYIASNK